MEGKYLSVDETSEAYKSFWYGVFWFPRVYIPAGNGNRVAIVHYLFSAKKGQSAIGMIKLLANVSQMGKGGGEEVNEGR